MKTCALCRNQFDSESPAVLYLSRYGTPQVLCASCEALIDTATAEEDSAEKALARERIAEAATHLKDHGAIAALRDVLNGVTSAEETAADEEAAALWEETKADDEEEEEQTEKKEEGFAAYIPLIVAGCLFIAFAVYMFFFR